VVAAPGRGWRRGERVFVRLCIAGTFFQPPRGRGRRAGYPCGGSGWQRHPSSGRQGRVSGLAAADLSLAGHQRLGQAACRPGRLAADAVSPGVVLAAFKAQPDASLVGSALRTERPAIMLRAITELHPTARGVRPRVPYPGWVVIYRHVRLVSYGLHSFSKNFRGTFVAIMDAATGCWTVFFNQGSSDGEG
jgi:hypothetical protein